MNQLPNCPANTEIKPENGYDMGTWRFLACRPAYIVYLVMMFVFVFGSYILYLHGKSVVGKKGKNTNAWAQIVPVAYSIFSALLGTQSVLFSKSLSVLLRTTFSGDSQVWLRLRCAPWFAWMFASTGCSDVTPAVPACRTCSWATGTHGSLWHASSSQLLSG
jgi:hypothetical protein